MSERTILHVDCNSFFASVEMKLNPQYRNVPMAVCGSAEDRHGIVLAKNEEAKSYGIVTAETITSARRKCPHLVIAEPHYEEYEKHSRAVKRIFERYTEQIESFGIDESWLDVTGSFKLFGTGEEIAKRIRREVKEEIGITVSIGVSFNKVFAKLGSDYKKPDAITVISRENYKDIVYPLAVESMLFIGKKTTQTLNAYGIYTIGDLAAQSEEFLVRRFGKIGHMMHTYATGMDTSPVAPQSGEQKSVSNGFTFRYDLVGFAACSRAINRLCEEIGAKLRKTKTKCTGVTLKMKDVFLKTYTKQIKLDNPTDITDCISRAAVSILPQLWEENKPVRTITVSVYGLIDSSATTEQMSFFDTSETEEKNSRRDQTLDMIREKFGEGAIVPLSLLMDDTGLGKT